MEDSNVEYKGTVQRDQKELGESGVVDKSVKGECCGCYHAAGSSWKERRSDGIFEEN